MQVYLHLFGYEHVDTEFAITQSGCVRLLQSRPVVQLEATNVVTVSLKHCKANDKVVQGSYSLLGSVSGRCNVITDFDALVRGEVKIDSDDILVTAKTSNYWNQFLTDLKGIITIIINFI